MAECKYRKDFTEFAIYNDDLIVGFTVFGIEPETNNYWIIAIIISEQYQNKGFGKQAILKLVELLKNRPNCKKIFIGHHPENKIANHVYESLGFIDTGKVEDGEIVRCLTI